MATAAQAPTAPIEDVPQLVSALLRRYDLGTVAQATRIPPEALKQVAIGRTYSVDRRQVWALCYFCQDRRDYDLISTYLPSYDRRGAFDFETPPLGFEIPVPDRGQFLSRPTELAGLEVTFPFGISASVLTRNSKAITFFAERGFDVCTYKTVRTKATLPHDPPNWVFVDGDQHALQRIRPPFAQVMIGDPDYVPNGPDRVTMANSFGVPSQDPDVWVPDVTRAKRALGHGQVLIVSVMATPPVNDPSEQALIDDFAQVAHLAKGAGADIIEANYSCPNTPGNPAGTLFSDPRMSGLVSRAIKNAIGRTPLFTKIGYLNEVQLTEFMRANRRFVQGIVGINTIPMLVEWPDGSPMFHGQGRERAGISGAAIRPWAREVIQHLVALRETAVGGTSAFSIVAVGGVGTPRDVADYLELGADAVESTTAAFLNPRLAIETRDHVNEEMFPLDKGPWTRNSKKGTYNTGAMKQESHPIATDGTPEALEASETPVPILESSRRGQPVREIEGISNMREAFLLELSTREDVLPAVRREALEALEAFRQRRDEWMRTHESSSHRAPRNPSEGR